VLREYAHYHAPRTAPNAAVGGRRRRFLQAAGGTREPRRQHTGGRGEVERGAEVGAGRVAATFNLPRKRNRAQSSVQLPA
jgi:hypothetical protein